MRMKGGFMAISLAGGLISAVVSWQMGSEPTVRTAAPVRAASRAQGDVAQLPSGRRQISGTPEALMAEGIRDPAEQPLFLTSQDHVVINPQARDDIERLVALYSRDQALSTLDASTADLPPQVQREVLALY